MTLQFRIRHSLFSHLSPLLLSGLLFSAQAEARTLRIVNGTPGSVETYPWMASFLGCGGTLIAPNWILTAAHCFLNEEGTAVDNSLVDITATLGRTDMRDTSKGQEISVKRFIIHPNYRPDPDSTNRNDFDIALLELSETVNQQTIALLGNGDSAIPAGTRTVETGWGTLAETPLNFLETFFGTNDLQALRNRGVDDKSIIRTVLLSNQVASFNESLLEHPATAQTTSRDVGNARPELGIGFTQLQKLLTDNGGTLPEPLTFDALFDALTAQGKTAENIIGEIDVQPNQLQQTSLPHVPIATCKNKLGSDITDNMICAGFTEGGTSNCSGDSGGPRILPDVGSGPVQIGIASFSSLCAGRGNYDVYTRVSAFESFIRQHVPAAKFVNLPSTLEPVFERAEGNILGAPNAIDASGNALSNLSTSIAGGISVNRGSYQTKAEQKLADMVDVSGSILVDPQHVNQTAEIVVYAKATISGGSAVFMLGEGLQILNWDQQPQTLVPFIRNVNLARVQRVSLYGNHRNTFVLPGTLEIFFGYRLADGTVVTNTTPIDVTINQ